ncbi:hypothetical protein DFH28DRAFT_887496 [Melampsora americana]|nr:hypothetical protein DFH28DRAFT_887496 [Melampsora americana]
MLTLFDPASVWEPSSAHLKGDDAPAAPADGHPLFETGSFERELFDNRYEAVVAVKFKIHTDTKVVVDPATSIHPAPAHRCAAATVNVIDSKVFHDGVPYGIRTCLYGKSWNQFKDLAAQLCEQYTPGMYKMVFHSEVHRSLTWKATVGRSKTFVLQDKPTRFEFVEHLSQSRARRASLLIHTESLKLTAKKKAQLINATNGPGAVEIELAQANEQLAQVALHVLTAKLFHHYAEAGNAGGNGVVLVAPWDPNFHYRFTLHDAFIWAKAMQRNEATKHMPPNISEYRSEIAKTRVFHPGMKLKDRLKLRLPDLTTKVTNRSKLHGSPSKKTASTYGSPSRTGGKNQMLTKWSSRRQKLVKLEKSGEFLIHFFFFCSVFFSMQRLTPFDLPQGTFAYPSDQAKSEVEYSSANTDEIECLKEHEALLDSFVKECGVTKKYGDTRNLLIKSGIKSWVDLVPSVKMTQAVLIDLGVTRELAGCLLAKAQERHESLTGEFRYHTLWFQMMD